ncbi:hypothetical protein BTR23_22910 [Alkalihalophilus pseudofirmus]|nr:hypothetical protein BTR23_22910 [Alkalihalophilus pseudofirmus]
MDNSNHQSQNQSRDEENNHLPNDYHTSIEQKGTRGRKPWYNQGWLWLLVALIGIVVLFFGFSSLIEEIGKMNESLQGQTNAINEQNDVLHSIREGINDMTVAIRDAFTTIKNSIQGSV